ncbi:hypothetical protein GCM10017691_16980 [Pseudonocardia petroleophila]|uniref:non-specific serine/threonine protein kinase n=1 Tax=Pseudonocardia petroleophila TaxID=37331 RepID=A0A7G7MHH6_9PSEU|nr:serine/threonine-protein kinase [Pseudonocardia petroleophila]QNG52237.1 protein kinase [Pseudonocardia petroleophila]
MASEMFGPYRLDGLLGQGGMGRVFRAFDTDLARTVALKVLTADLSADPEYRQRFRREALVAAQLTDPHVVPIHKHGEIDGQLFLDMRFVDGDDLAAVLSGSGPLDAESAVVMIGQVASALDAAHEAGLVHRDVKPANVFLTRDRPSTPRFAYLGDFGIARQTSGGSLTASGATVGTLDYMAPERFGGLDVDGRSDVYALGCLLFESLTGRRPFPDREPAALMNAHVRDAPPRPSEHGAPPGLDAVVARAMAKDPAQRYPTAGELAADARAALDPERVPDPATVPVPAGAQHPAPASFPRPDGRAPDGRAPDSRAPDSRAPDSRAPDSRVPDGRIPDGRPASDGGPDRSAPYRPVANGPAPGLPPQSLPPQSRPLQSRPASGPGQGPGPDAPWPAPEPAEATPPPRPRRALLATALLLGAVAHFLVLENVSFETGLLFWTLSGTLFGTLTAGALRPRRWGSGRTTTLLVLTLPVVLVAVLLVALGLGLAESGTAIVVATLGVYGVWALTLWRRRTRRPAERR